MVVVPGSLRPPWRPCTRTGLPGGDGEDEPPSGAHAPRPAAAWATKIATTRTASTRTRLRRGREGLGGEAGVRGRSRPGKLPSRWITATTARLQSSPSISLSGEQDPAQPARLGPCRNVQGPSSQSIDIETSRITHTRAHTRAHSSINPLPPPSSPSSPSSPAPPAPSRCRPARGPERRPRAPAWCP